MQWAVLILTLIVLIYLAFKKPRGLIFLLPAAVALEISSEWYPYSMALAAAVEYRPLKSLLVALGLITLARLLIYILIPTALLNVLRKREFRRRLTDILHEPLLWLSLLYIIAGFASALYSVKPDRSLVEGSRLLILFALMISVALFGKKRLAKPLFQLVHAVGLLLAPLTFYEALTGRFLWQEQLALVDRVNATFVDPNIFARYLVLAVISNLILQYFAEGKAARLAYFASLLVLLGELAVTQSRGGILTLVLVGLLLIFLMPKRRIRETLGVLAGLGITGTIAVTILKPSIWTRLLTLKEGINALDETRLYLIKAGLAMFKDYPGLGLGLGTYQYALVTYYYEYQTKSYGATLSHTTLVTIAAELGLLGLSILALIWIGLIRILYRLRQAGQHVYVYGTGFFLWILTVFLSSQAEGRFFEDPMVWLSMGMLITLANSPYEQGEY